MIRIREIDHLVLRISDLDAMLQFYVDVLGCSMERQLDSIGLVQLRAGSSLIDLVPINPQPDGEHHVGPNHPARNLDHFCVRVDPFDETVIRKHLEDFGINAGSLESRYGAEGVGPSIYINDPEGNVVELKGPPDTLTDHAR